MTAPTVLDSRYSWGRLGITLAIGSVSSVGIWAFIAILPAAQAEFGLGRGGASVPYAVSMLGFALGNLLVGRMVDRLGVVPSLIGAACLLSAGFALSTLAPSLAVFTLLHFLIGFGSAAGFGPLMADVSHWFMRRRGIAVTVAASGNYIAGALWPWALSGLLAEEGWRAFYLALERFGYDITDGRKAVEAFQRRWRPEKINGEIDGEVRAILFQLLLDRDRGHTR